MPPIAETERFVARLKKAGYKIYLLSNATPRVFDEYHNIPAFKYFDGMFVSALYKLLKPSAEIYNAFCDKFSLKAEECFFIDDMEANIKGAKACGMKGFVFDTRDYEALEKALNDEKVIF
jgi:putative hydrolase of the HAD superfamily